MCEFVGARCFTLAFLFIVFGSTLVAQTQAKQCAKNNEFCLQHTDCCSRVCLTYLVRCTRNLSVIVDPDPPSEATLDQILHNAFGSDDFKEELNKHKNQQNQHHQHQHQQHNHYHPQPPEYLNPQLQPPYVQHHHEQDLYQQQHQQQLQLQEELELQREQQQQLQQLQLQQKQQLIAQQNQIQQQQQLIIALQLQLEKELEHQRRFHHQQEQQNQLAVQQELHQHQEEIQQQKPLQPDRNSLDEANKINDITKRTDKIKETIPTLPPELITTSAPPTTTTTPVSAFEVSELFADQEQSTADLEIDVRGGTQDSSGSNINCSTSALILCKKIGEKCYRHTECCTRRCHGFLHQCVT